MKKTIYKYPIQILDSQIVEMPENAKILSVQFQREQLCIWAMVDADKKLEKRQIRIYGTGHIVNAVHGAFIGTVQQLNGALVWHVFDGGVK